MIKKKDYLNDINISKLCLSSKIREAQTKKDIYEQLREKIQIDSRRSSESSEERKRRDKRNDLLFPTEIDNQSLNHSQKDEDINNQSLLPFISKILKKNQKRDQEFQDLE